MDEVNESSERPGSSPSDEPVFDEILDEARAVNDDGRFLDDAGRRIPDEDRLVEDAERLVDDGLRLAEGEPVADAERVVIIDDGGVDGAPVGGADTIGDAGAFE